MFSLVTVAVLFLVCLPPETASQQCSSGVTDEIRQSVREQLRQGRENGTIPTVAVNCGQVHYDCQLMLQNVVDYFMSIACCCKQEVTPSKVQIWSLGMSLCWSGICNIRRFLYRYRVYCKNTCANNQPPCQNILHSLLTGVSSREKDAHHSTLCTKPCNFYIKCYHFQRYWHLLWYGKS